MDDHIPVINHDPAIPGLALLFAFFEMVAAHGLQRGVGECIQHAITGAGAQDEIIGKRCDVFDVKQKDVLALFVFERGHNGAGQIDCVQNFTSELDVMIPAGSESWMLYLP